jgi:hypothetical protein
MLPKVMLFDAHNRRHEQKNRRVIVKCVWLYAKLKNAIIMNAFVNLLFTDD